MYVYIYIPVLNLHVIYNGFFSLVWENMMVVYVYRNTYTCSSDRQYRRFARRQFVIYISRI